MLDSSAIPIIVGLSVGVAFVLVFALVSTQSPLLMQAGSASKWNTFYIHVNDITLVAIPQGASLADSEKTYEPQVIRVVIGVNNTVRWINQDKVPHWIEADNQSDPDFYKATAGGSNDTANKLIMPNESFDHTFTRAGTFGYHGQPHLRGTVVVMPHICGLPIDDVNKSATFTLLLPTELPYGYSLQSVDYVPEVYLTMQYFTRTLCDPEHPYSPDEDIIEIVEGPLSKASDAKSGQEYVQTEMTKYVASNFNATSYVFQDGRMHAIGYDTGTNYNAHLWVIDDKTETIVKIEARSTYNSLEQLVAMGASLK